MSTERAKAWLFHVFGLTDIVEWKSLVKRLVSLEPTHNAIADTKFKGRKKIF